MPTRQPNLALILTPVQVELKLVDTWQVLVDDPLAALEGFPHRDVAHCVACDNEVVYLTEAVDWVVLVNVRNVTVVQSVLYLAQEIIRGGFRSYHVGGASFVDYRGVTVFFAVVVHYSIAGDDDVFILVYQLFCAK